MSVGPESTQVFYCSTFFGLSTLAAALDAGAFGASPGRRLLLVSSNGENPEISTPVDATPGFEKLRDRFDDVVSWNAVIAPLHPADWVPRAAELPMLSRLVRERLGVTGPITELVLESMAVAPARTIAALLRDCPISVYSDGAMSYGPTRNGLPEDVLSRITRLLHLDLVPGLTPLLLRESGAVPEIIPASAFRAVLDQLPGPTGATTPGVPLVLGQYLAALEIVTAEEEIKLYADMVRALVAAGHHTIAFKPHPAAGSEQVRELAEVAAQHDARLEIVEDRLPVEIRFAADPPAIVVSCFSTALLTAREIFGLPVATSGCELVLERATPYQNSNRIPVTIVDATVPRLRVNGSLAEPRVTDIQALVRAVGFCMQAAQHPDLRADAVTYLRAYGPGRYFKRRRLEALELTPAPLRRSPQVLYTRAVARRRVEMLRKAVARSLP